VIPPVSRYLLTHLLTGVSAINTVRWDAPYMAGTVEARGVSLAYLKDEE